MTRTFFNLLSITVVMPKKLDPIQTPVLKDALNELTFPSIHLYQESRLLGSHLLS
jgi:hypothetical protein